MMSDCNSGGEDFHQRGRQISGVAVGIVTSHKDEKKLGRVQVRFKWASGEKLSKWARIATLSSGPNRGSMFIPEVNDEVLLAFERDNVNRPFVIGSIWNDEGKPPGPDIENNTIKKIKTISGHEIIFSDEKGKEKIEIYSKSKHKIILDDDPEINKITIKDNKDDYIEINSKKGSITISSSKDLILKSNNVKIDAKSTMSLKSGGPMTIEGATVSIN